LFVSAGLPITDYRLHHRLIRPPEGIDIDGALDADARDILGADILGAVGLE